MPQWTHRIDLAMEKLQAYLAGIPNELENKTEKHYQTIIYLIFSLLGFYIRTEVKSAIGRADAVCYTDNCIYVFEFKVDGSAEDALKQIDDKGYMLPYKFEEGKNLVKVTYSGRYPFIIPVIPVHFFVSKDRYLLRS